MEQKTENKLDFSQNEELFRREAIENTPFIKLWSKEKGWALGIAEHRITKWYETEKEITTLVKGTQNGKLDWNLLTAVILILIEKDAEMKKLITKIGETKNDN